MGEQITRILVPVDFSAHSENAVNYATKLAQRFGGTVELLHVVEDLFASGAWSAEAFTPNIPELMNDLMADARRRLDALKTAAAKGGVTLATHVVTGQPSRLITEFAKTGAFDLIVMGTHGRTGLSHVLLGSVAERVVRTAPCPVLTMRDTTSHPSESGVEVAATVS